MKVYEFSVLVRANSPEDALEGVRKSIPFIAKESEFPDPKPDATTFLFDYTLKHIESKTF